ncbi:lipase family protein [Phaeacidiphilus oryzae]|uniref:lipase family protein n=1 Tax=Phaeacidiphilus oryzae TaxID=348818 RepID=UPI00190F4A34|nr:lipase family protein [Phaeacidiphilus oryzae]
MAAAVAAAVAMVLAAAPGAVAAPAGAAGAAGASSTSTLAAGSVPPDQDPFYQAPANIGSYRSGAIVATRPVAPAGLGLAADQIQAWQISYRTNDSHNRPELAVTTLIVPAAAWGGAGARPVLSVQQPEDSTGTQCAPSYQVASGGSSAVEYEAFVAPALARGWAVAMPDFEGPKSVFMAGIQAAHAVLDGLRAVRNFDRDGIGRANPVGLNGYSGGAEATGWAAQLQPRYAPDVKLAAAAVGGMPAVPAAVARYLDGGPFAGFEMAAALSYQKEYPESGIARMLNSSGRAAMAAADNQCTSTLLAEFAFKKLSGYTTVADPLSQPNTARVLQENAMGGAAPATPVYDYHAVTDEIVPVAQDDATVAAWRAEGAQVTEVRDPVGEHAEEAVLRMNDALQFLSNHF